MKVSTMPCSSAPISSSRAKWHAIGVKRVCPLAFGPVGFFLPGLAGLESLTKRMEAAAARVKLKVAV